MSRIFEITSFLLPSKKRRDRIFEVTFGRRERRVSNVHGWRTRMTHPSSRSLFSASKTEAASRSRNCFLHLAGKPFSRSRVRAPDSLFSGKSATELATLFSPLGAHLKPAGLPESRRPKSSAMKETSMAATRDTSESETAAEEDSCCRRLPRRCRSHSKKPPSNSSWIVAPTVLLSSRIFDSLARNSTLGEIRQDHCEIRQDHFSHFADHSQERD